MTEGGGLLGGTVSQVGERFQHSPLEGSYRVLHAGPEAQHALQLGLLYQQVSVGGQLMGAAEQSCDAVHKLGHQARVGVVGLAVVVGHDLGGAEPSASPHPCHTAPSTTSNGEVVLSVPCDSKVSSFYSLQLSYYLASLIYSFLHLHGLLTSRQTFN